MRAVTAADQLTVEFAGEVFPVRRGERFTVGREGDLAIDDNLFLHRNFLVVEDVDGLWILSNVGSRLAATVTDAAGRVSAWLAPGARLPLVFETTTIIFSAGPTTYEVTVHAAAPTFRETAQFADDGGQSTIGDVPLTLSQRLMILALAEPVLRRDGSGMSELPTSAQAAERLGWTLTRFNRKLDNVCEKLSKVGVPGLRGGRGEYATSRRMRLVEHAIAARMVTRTDLPLLDQPQVDDGDHADLETGGGA